MRTCVRKDTGFKALTAIKLYFISIIFSPPEDRQEPLLCAYFAISIFAQRVWPPSGWASPVPPVVRIRSGANLSWSMVRCTYGKARHQAYSFSVLFIMKICIGRLFICFVVQWFIFFYLFASGWWSGHGRGARGDRMETGARWCHAPPDHSANALCGELYCSFSFSFLDDEEDFQGHAFFIEGAKAQVHTRSYFTNQPVERRDASCYGRGCILGLSHSEAPEVRSYTIIFNQDTVCFRTHSGYP